jgi:hypothetical protein
VFIGAALLVDLIVFDLLNEAILALGCVVIVLVGFMATVDRLVDTLDGITVSFDGKRLLFRDEASSLIVPDRVGWASSNTSELLLGERNCSVGILLSDTDFFVDLREISIVV